MGIEVTHDFSKVLNVPGTILIVGLGNVGDKYTDTRHNAGFMAVDHIAKENNLGKFTEKKSLFAEIVEGKIGTQKVVLAKPTTLMNASGKAILALQSYFKLDNGHLIVIHDDIDTEFGTLRMRVSSGHGGHNGLKSVDNAIGDDYARIKIGVKNGHRDEIDASDFVLQSFSKNELLQLENAWPHIGKVIQEFIDGNKFDADSVSF